MPATFLLLPSIGPEPPFFHITGSAFRYHLGETCTGVPAWNEDVMVDNDRIGCYTNDFDIHMTKKTWENLKIEEYIKKNNKDFFKDATIFDAVDHDIIMYKRNYGADEGLDIHLVENLPPSVKGSDGIFYATTGWLCEDIEQFETDASQDFKSARRTFRKDKICLSDATRP